MKTDGLDALAVFQLFMIAAKSLFAATRSKPATFPVETEGQFRDFASMLATGFDKKNTVALAKQMAPVLGLPVTTAPRLDCQPDPNMPDGDLEIDYALPNWGAAKVTFTRKGGLKGGLIMTRCDGAPIFWGLEIATFCKVDGVPTIPDWFVPVEMI